VNKKAPTYPGYGVKIGNPRLVEMWFTCFHPLNKDSFGAGATREEAMFDFARRQMMTDDEFLDSHCKIVG
jgi:hypothetical protein